MRFKKHRILFVLLTMFGSQSAIAAGRPTVLELFTSQGCSSCPPADALLAKMANDGSVIPLSLHVDYWDNLGWKDPLSAPEMTERQRAYSAALRRNNVFTPQLMVDGAYSVVGSDGSAVSEAIASARRHPAVLPVTLTLQADGRHVVLTIPNSANTELPASAEVTAFYYTRSAKTEVPRGENSGRTLQNINNVTRIERETSWKQGKEFSLTLSAPASANEGLAVVVQREGQGAVIGAASITGRL